MRIVHVSQQDDESGGFKAAYRLHAAQRRAGLDSRLLVLCKLTDDPSVTAHVRPRLLAKVVWRLLGTLNDLPVRRYPRQPVCGWTGSRYPTGATLRLRRLRPDIVHLHLFDCLLTYREVARLPGAVCWTFHDMGSLTGGCHCTPACTRYRERCGACPELGSSREDDLSRRGWYAKHAAWSRPDLTAVSPSRWLADEAARSPMCAGHRVAHIPNGVPLAVFHPSRRAAARARLGFRDDRFYLLAGAASLANPLKGLAFVADALARLGRAEPGRFELVRFGRGGSPLPGVTVRDVGYVRTDAEMADLYAACDAYVLATLVDNLPNMLLESVACGTPCVTFRVGGCPDVVRDGVTGAVAAGKTGEALAASLRELAGRPAGPREALRASCRAVAEAEYGDDRQAQRCLALYRELLAGKAGVA